MNVCITLDLQESYHSWWGLQYVEGWGYSENILKVTPKRYQNTIPHNHKNCNF